MAPSLPRPETGCSGLAGDLEILRHALAGNAAMMETVARDGVNLNARQMRSVHETANRRLNIAASSIERRDSRLQIGADGRGRAEVAEVQALDAENRRKEPASVVLPVVLGDNTAGLRTREGLGGDCAATTRPGVLPTKNRRLEQTPEHERLAILWVEGRF